MMNQGRYLNDDKVSRIVELLRHTDTQMCDIARRMGVSRSAVVLINKKHGIRTYGGKRITWQCA